MNIHLEQLILHDKCFQSTAASWKIDLDADGRLMCTILHKFVPPFAKRIVNKIKIKIDAIMMGMDQG